MLENSKLLEKVGRKATGLNRNSEIRMQGCLTDSNSSTYKSAKLRNQTILFLPSYSLDTILG